MKKFIIPIVCFCTALIVVGCNSETTNTIENPSPSVNVSTVPNEDKTDINAIAANDSLSLSEKVQAAKDSINLNEYISPEYDNIIPKTPDEILEMKNNGETFIVYHGRSDCKFCKYIYPMTSETLPEGVVAYYVNTDYFRYMYPEDENCDLFPEIAAIHDEYKTAFDFTGVPNLKYIKNGKLVHSVSNPLSGEFFSDTATTETKEYYLEEAKNVLKLHMSIIYNDMTGTVPLDNTNNTSNDITINK